MVSPLLEPIDEEQAVSAKLDEVEEDANHSIGNIQEREQIKQPPKKQINFDMPKLDKQVIQMLELD